MSRPKRRFIAGLAGCVLAAGIALPGESASSAVSSGSAWARVAPPDTPEVTDPLQRRGREVFWARCQACHGKVVPLAKPVLFNLPAMPGTVALQAKHQGAVPAELEARTDLTPEFIAYVVRRGSGHMPFFRPTELSREDLKAVQAWLCRPR